MKLFTKIKRCPFCKKLYKKKKKQGTKADVALAFGGQPFQGDILYLGKPDSLKAFNFVQTDAQGNDILVSSDLSKTLINAVNAINNSDEGANITASHNNLDTLFITYNKTGIEGNAYVVSWDMASFEVIGADGEDPTYYNTVTLSGGS